MGKDVLSSNTRQDKKLTQYNESQLQTIADNKKHMCELFLHLDA